MTKRYLVEGAINYTCDGKDKSSKVATSLYAETERAAIDAVLVQFKQHVRAERFRSMATTAGFSDFTWALPPVVRSESVPDVVLEHTPRDSIAALWHVHFYEALELYLLACKFEQVSPVLRSERARFVKTACFISVYTNGSVTVTGRRRKVGIKLLELLANGGKS